MLTIRALSDGKGYSSKHLEHSDYYAEGERVVGRWAGRAAEMLGLRGPVRGEDFESFRQGPDPRTGEFLRQRPRSDPVACSDAPRGQPAGPSHFTFTAPTQM